MNSENIADKRQKRSVVMSARFTPAEHETIRRQAKEAGGKPSRFARLMILTGKVVQRLSLDDAATLRGLAGMGNNLNQLARKANAEGYRAAATEMVTLRAQIIEILNLLSNDWKNKQRAQF